MPKGLLPDLIAREYGDTQLVSHDTNTIAAMIGVLSDDRCQHGIYVGVNPVESEYGRPLTAASIK